MNGIRAALRHLVGLAAILCLTATALPNVAAVAAAAAARPLLSDARVDEQDTTTRLVFQLSQPVEFRVFGLANPDRIVVDLDRVDWGVGESTVTFDGALVRRVRYGVFRPETSRIVIDCRHPAAVQRSTVTATAGGHELVVELTPVTAPARTVAKSRSASARAKTPVAARLSLPPPSRKPFAPWGRRVVVLDPGHGGKDTGAISPSGMMEKSLTLTAARLVAEELRRDERYKVVLTREGDEFVKLRKRVAVARAARADLFISLHADAHRSRSVRGASVYTLSERASDKEAAELAERENKADLINGVDLSHQLPEVTNILIDLAQRETLNESAKLANVLVKALAQETKTLRNTHRFAGFAVLKAPDVPSVLVELGYLSNPKDERLLSRKAHLRSLAKAIAGAVERYFQSAEALAQR